MTDKWAEHKQKFCGCKDASRLNRCQGRNNCELPEGHPERVIAAPSQPEGEGLEVVGWYHSHAEVATSDKARVVTWLPECIEPLCRLSDHLRAIAELREECERLRKAPVSKADSNAQLVGVCIERDTLRQQLAERDAELAMLRDNNRKEAIGVNHLLSQRDNLAGLLYEASGELRTDRHHGLGPRIVAALAEVNK